jgi:glutamate synthase (NADPH/NADH) small chain
VALIGAGPASLACAAELRRRGIRAHLYDVRPLPGGLNTYGVAEYKLPLVESLREIEMLSQLGVEFHFETLIDSPMLAELERNHDAIFLGIGLGTIHQLGIAGEQLPGVTNALDLIAGYKSGKLTAVPPRVVVVGAGNTAIDAAIASVRLGATNVHIVYRRGEEQMSAFTFEYEHARLEGVKFLWHAQPTRILGGEAVQELELTSLAASADGSIIPQDGSEFRLPVDMVVLAIGQGTQISLLDALAGGSEKLQLERGRIVINRATGQTSHPKYYAGGDCTNGGREVVDAVADGKRAGIGIAAWLEAKLARA